MKFAVYKRVDGFEGFYEAISGDTSKLIQCHRVKLFMKLPKEIKVRV